MALAGISVLVGGPAFAAGTSDDEIEWVLVDGKCVPGPQISIDPPVTDEEPWPDEATGGPEITIDPPVTDTEPWPDEATGGPEITIDPPVTDAEPWPDEVTGDPGVTIDPPVTDIEPWAATMSSISTVSATTMRFAVASTASVSTAAVSAAAVPGGTGDCVEPTPTPTATPEPTATPAPTASPEPSTAPEPTATATPQATESALPPVTDGNDNADAAPSALAETGSASPVSLGIVAMLLMAGGGVLAISRRWMRNRSEVAE